MTDPLDDLSSRMAPTLAEFEDLAWRAFNALPVEFRDMCEGLVIRIEDFADDEILEDMQIDNEFELMGLFHGRGLPQRGSGYETGEMPNMIWLYRRPILDYWCEHAETLGAVITHVLVHEIGHHFGFSDEDMEAIERQAD